MDIIEKVRGWLQRNRLLVAEWCTSSADGSAIHVVAIDGWLGPIRVEARQRSEAYRRATIEVHKRFGTA